jgi:hypothetical protein
VESEDILQAQRAHKTIHTKSIKRTTKELLQYHGFTISTVKGAPGVEPRELALIDKLLSRIPSLARRIIVLAKK